MSAQDRSETIRFIEEKIQLDPQAADLHLSLFSAALHSYRYDTVLRPFPPMFLQSDTEKDKTALEKVFKEIPKITNISNEINKLSDNALNLLKWIFESKRFNLRSLSDKNSFESIQKLTGNNSPVPPPSYIFELEPSEASNEKFQEIRQNRKLMYAYHGSRTENFHSILHNGLASHMNKTSVFGEGTYLSGELGVSLNYSPSGYTWANSEIGKMFGLIAVCEMIDDPTVKCQTNETNGSKKKSRAYAANSMGGDVPEKYYVVQNNEVIRLKYILIYVDKNNSTQTNRLVQPTFFQEHKFVIMLFFYAFLLLGVGLANSKTFKYHIKRLLK
ncbi:hypothetical protein SNE40_003568 [Patella caerulea]|uniref:Poly [ADP-ribose] polymerase n=1 Tax=Patella caerulea TaxID=87958 RepID=A0AAN8KB47_PATCE